MMNEVCPANMKDIVREAIVSEIKNLKRRGYRMPKDYNAEADDLDASEITLYQMQDEKNEEMRRRRVKGVISGTAKLIAWITSVCKIDIVNASSLPTVINEALSNGDFDDDLEGLSESIRGTFLDNPGVSTMITFWDKLSKAEEVEAKKQEARKHHEQKHGATVAHIRQLREGRTNALSKDEEKSS